MGKASKTGRADNPGKNRSAGGRAGSRFGKNLQLAAIVFFAAFFLLILKKQIGEIDGVRAKSGIVERSIGYELEHKSNILRENSFNREVERMTQIGRERLGLVFDTDVIFRKVYED